MISRDSDRIWWVQNIFKEKFTRKATLAFSCISNTSWLGVFADSAPGTNTRASSAIHVQMKTSGLQTPKQIVTRAQSSSWQELTGPVQEKPSQYLFARDLCCWEVWKCFSSPCTARHASDAAPPPCALPHPSFQMSIKRALHPKFNHFRGKLFIGSSEPSTRGIDETFFCLVIARLCSLLKVFPHHPLSRQCSWLRSSCSLIFWRWPGALPCWSDLDLDGTLILAMVCNLLYRLQTTAASLRGSASWAPPLHLASTSSLQLSTLLAFPSETCYFHQNSIPNIFSQLSTTAAFPSAGT